LWARDSQQALAQLIQRERPQLAHFINTFPLISPAAYATCKQAGLPVVQALHNYRLACPAATFLRAGSICEDCPDHGLQQAIVHACYRGSRAASANVVAMLALHRALGTYQRNVDLYTVLTQFAHDKLIATADLPAARVVVRPNFLHPDPGPGVAPAARSPHALFVGRLSQEKGVHTLLNALTGLPRSIRLRIVGDGPLMAAVRRQIDEQHLGRVELVGQLPTEAVLDEMKRARVLILPSEWYEGLPITLLEAFACATPVIASSCGALQELITDGDNGLRFAVGDARDLARCIEAAWNSEPLRASLGARGRACFEQHYSLRSGVSSLLDLYQRVLRARA